MQTRKMLMDRLFPNGVPRLWCPAITHYRDDGTIDAGRARAHLRFLARYVGGLLVPGSTGDGWDQSRDLKRTLLDVVLPEARRLGLPVLLGVLERTADTMQTFLTEFEAVTGDAVAGIVVCPPSGAELSQAEIREALERVLGRGRPTVLYQLPQVTMNEMSPGTVDDLAGRYPNLIMVKDSGGGDAIARSGLARGVVLVRGAELDYANWIKPLGPYDGFLLSTANWLAHAIRELVDDPAGSIAGGLATRIDRAVSGAFELVGGFPHGNAFANSAKLMDHVMAFGERAAERPGPRFMNGSTAPQEAVAAGVTLLRETGFLPPNGYCEAGTDI